ncbi:MAG: RNA-binding protein [Gammaproteobacteria bacterium]|nr:MAG: RNA-binding protein [Gammaproteobacteria bacterium]
MGKRLYVGNLPYTVSEQDLIDKFAAIGTVESATLITDRDSGRSKGFGFVEMATDAEAQKAIEEVNGTDYDGRPVTVNEAKPMNKRDSGSRW